MDKKLSDIGHGHANNVGQNGCDILPHLVGWRTHRLLFKIGFDLVSEGE